MKTIQIQLLFIGFLIAIITPSTAQPCSDYSCVIQKIKKAIDSKNYHIALSNLESAESFPNKDVNEIDKLRSRLIQTINDDKALANKAKINEVFAKKAVGDAKEAKEQRDYALNEANRLAAIAEMNKKIAIAATNQVKTANAKTLEFLVREIDQNVLKLEYETAFKKCEMAINLDSSFSDIEVVKRILEIAFVYTETNELANAQKTLNLLNIVIDTNRIELLRIISAYSFPQYFKFLKERYYPKMVDVKEGVFEREGLPISLNRFRLSTTETTVWQYHLFVKAQKRKEPKSPSWQWFGDNPIVNISWFDAIHYLNWLSERFNLKPVYDVKLISRNVVKINYQANGFRLPTEAEWEFAARSGIYSENYDYSGSSNLNEVAWWNGNSNSKPNAVGQKKANRLGFFDMTGNVSEWCNDQYAKYDRSSINNPRGADMPNPLRSVRGGSWKITDVYPLLTKRYYLNHTFKEDFIGFRVAQGY